MGGAQCTLGPPHVSLGFELFMLWCPFPGPCLSLGVRPVTWCPGEWGESVQLLAGVNLLIISKDPLT